MTQKTTDPAWLTDEDRKKLKVSRRIRISVYHADLLERKKMTLQEAVAFAAEYVDIKREREIAKEERHIAKIEAKEQKEIEKQQLAEEKAAAKEQEQRDKEYRRAQYQETWAGCDVHDLLATDLITQSDEDLIKEFNPKLYKEFSEAALAREEQHLAQRNKDLGIKLEDNATEN